MSISSDSEQGWFLENDERVVILRATTFQKFADQLIAITGSKIGELLLYKMGTTIGQISFQTSKYHLRSGVDSWKAFDERLKFRGWGRCVDMTTRTEGNRTIYTFKLKGTPTSYKRVAMEPTCHVMRGIIAGWLESLLEKKADTTSETECASTGVPFCVFEVAFSTG